LGSKRKKTIMSTSKHSLHPELQQKLEEQRKKKNFNPSQWIEAKVTLFNKYMRDNGLKAAVVSLSGGVDSSVTLGLMKRALDQENSPIKRILGIAQPIHSSAWALERGREVAEAFKTPFAVIDQTNLHTQLTKLVDESVGIKGENFATGQLRSYMRTPVNYYVAQLLSQQGTPCIVMGTGNQDEDGYLAYFCKAGDGVVDVQLISDLHKSEVFAVGKVLGVPNSVLIAPPSADLWEGQTDEDELGFSYDFIELLTGTYLKLDDAGKKQFLDSLSTEAREIFLTLDKAAEGIHNRNKHKISGPVNLRIVDP